MNNYILYIKDITNKINLQIIIDSSFTLRDLKDEICKKFYKRTKNPKLKKLAKEIIDVQEKEIKQMKSML